MRKTKWIVSSIYLIFGIYFVNLAFGFYEIPKAVLDYSQVINLIAGILIILGGISSFRIRKHKHLGPKFDFA
jgi:cytochrome c biogenesis protein CcdA